MRKAEEAVITVMLEAMLPKRRILEIYLNVIEWGNGVFGAEAAARQYFGVSAAQLSAEQAARLAAMAPNPRFYERNQGAPGLNRKIGIILARMPGAEFPESGAAVAVRMRTVPRSARTRFDAAAPPCPRPSKRRPSDAPKRASACRTRSPKSRRSCASTGWSKASSTSSSSMRR